MPPRRSARSKSPAKAAKDAIANAAADATATKRRPDAREATDEGARTVKAARTARGTAAGRGSARGGGSRGLTTRAIEDDALFATARETWRRNDGEAAYDGEVVRKIYEEELGGGERRRRRGDCRFWTRRGTRNGFSPSARAIEGIAIERS